MGAVFEGVNVETEERAAVKVLSSQLAHEHDFRQRFAAEIETLRRLNHPNIVRLFGFGQQQDQLYYVMELVDGVSLEEEIQRGRRFDWREAIHIGTQMCLALRHAHDRGVIHRDIKPANLLWARDGTVKLSDFGIARLFGMSGLTTAGSVIGTVEYMAPEQADGRVIGPQADLYSLGSVLYAMLAGRPPFVAKTLPEMLHKQRYERPEMLTDAADDVPEDLANLVDQLLEKDPAQRVRNAMLLGRRLEAIRLGLERKAAEARRAREDGFRLADKPSPPDEPDPASLAVTRAIADEDAPVTPTPTPAGGLPATLATDVFAGLAPPAPGDFTPTAQTDPSDGPVTTDRFTAVAEHELDQAPEPPAPRPALISTQTGVLVAAILAIGFFVLYVLRPPSADTLYARIKEITADGAQASMFQAKDEIERFLCDYAEDPRCREIRKLDAEIQLYVLERRFERRVNKGLEENKSLLPIEQAYLEAYNYTRLDPTLGAKKLRALIALYGHKTPRSGPTGQCLELARRKLAQIEEELDRSRADHLAMIQARLDHADELRQSKPDEARRMYEGTIELYGGKPWAAEPVRRAQQSLKTLLPPAGSSDAAEREKQ